LARYLHPANAEELANIAQETGAEVLRGKLRYPSESSGWQLGDLDLSEHLGKYRDRNLVVIIAFADKANEEQVTCSVCGFALNQAGECPRCELHNEKGAKRLRAKRQRNCSDRCKAMAVPRQTRSELFRRASGRNESASGYHPKRSSRSRLRPLNNTQERTVIL
jgi:hypothetical protein